MKRSRADDDDSDDDSDSSEMEVLASGAFCHQTAAQRMLDDSLGRLVCRIDDATELVHAFTQQQPAVASEAASTLLRSGCALKPYQHLALRWLLRRERNPMQGIRGGLLTLLPGLGKTLIALCLAALDPASVPTLVVVPHTVMYEWRANVSKFFDEHALPVLWFEASRMGGAEMLDRVTAADLLSYRLVVTTYPTVRRAYECVRAADVCVLKRADEIVGVRRCVPQHIDGTDWHGLQLLYTTPWHRVVFDEIQCVANTNTALFTACAALSGERRSGLSGMPVRNGSNDLYAQLFVLGLHTRYVTSARLRPLVFRSIQSTLDEEAFRDTVRRFLLMINYEQAGIRMPALHAAQVHAVALDANERRMYEHFAQGARRAYDTYQAQQASFTVVLERIMRARQACVAAYLTGGLPDSNSSPDTAALQRWCSRRSSTAGLRSSKLRRAARIVRRVVARNQKVVVYSSFVHTLQLLQQILTTGFDNTGESTRPQLARVPCCMLVGETATLERDEQLDTFRTSATHHCLLATLKVASAGLTLTEATHIVFLDPWWCYEQHWQAVFRAWRIGQQRDVYVHWLVAKHTIEERILQVCSQKVAVANAFLIGNELIDWPRRILSALGRTETDRRLETEDAGGNGTDANTIRYLLGV